MDDFPDALSALASRMDALEKRVHDLEHPGEVIAQAAAELGSAGAVTAPVDTFSVEQTGSIFPTLGKTMLGFAGGFLLRALAESAKLPIWVVEALAIAYAVGWLVLATKSNAKSNLASVVYGGTSILILGPMLWELIFRFKAMSPVGAAFVIVGFVVVATVFTWNRGSAVVYSTTQAACALIALALSIASHALMPFVFALLLMFLVAEYAAARDRGRSIRPWIALATDLAISGALFVYSGLPTSRTQYPDIQIALLLAPSGMLLLICAGSVAINTALLHRKITVFETGQCVLAFLLAVASILSFRPDGALSILGTACLSLSLLCYWGAFGVYRRVADQFNFRVFATWAMGLFLAGFLWLLSPNEAGACLSLAALISFVLGARYACLVLDFHGVVLLFTSALISGLFEYSIRTLAGPLTTRVSWSGLWVAACSLVCFATFKPRARETWHRQALHFISALVAASAVLALFVQMLLRLATLFITPDAFHVAFLRTLAVCSVATALAYGGASWRRQEMTQIAYIALAFEATKLIFEDMRLGHMEFTAASFILFATALFSVPRLARLTHKT